MHADGQAGPPVELEQLRYIDRFGAEAVMGRQLARGEMRRMVYAENIVRAVRRLREGRWQELEASEPDTARLARWALGVAYGKG